MNGSAAFSVPSFLRSLLNQGRSTLCVGGAVLVCSVLSLSSEAMANILALQPGHTLFGAHYLWNVFTSAFVASSYLWLCLMLPCVLYLSYPCEVYGASASYIVQKCLVAALAVSGLCTSIVFSVYYAATSEEYYYFTNHGGLFSLVMCLSIMALVADPSCQRTMIRIEIPWTKQQTPSDQDDAELGQGQGGGTRKNVVVVVINTKYFPVMLLGLALLDAVLTDDLSNLTFTLSAIVSTCLLMGILHNNFDDTGDASLPETVAQAFLVGRLLKALVALGKGMSCLDSNQAAASESSSNTRSGGTMGPVDSSGTNYHHARPDRKPSKTGPAPSADPLAERRRARALRVLDKKLSGLGMQTSSAAAKSKDDTISRSSSTKDASMAEANTADHVEDADEQENSR